MPRVDRRWRWPALALVAAFAVALAGCDINARNSATNPAVQRQFAEGGYAAEGAELSATDERGQPRYRLQADTIVQRPGAEPVDMTGVTVSFPDSRGQNWVLTAQAGRMSSTRSDEPAVVDLEGEVRLHSDGQGKAPPLTLATSRLRYDTARQRATTDDRVTLQSGERTIEARGLTADLGSRRLRLESQVHARFTP